MWAKSAPMYTTSRNAMAMAEPTTNCLARLATSSF